jgi:hypothetical protein
MDRWDELERLGKLRAEGLLSNEEFEAQKKRVLDAEEPSSAEDLPAASADGEPTRGWIKYAAVAGAIAFVVLLLWMLSPGADERGNRSETVIANTTAPMDGASARPATYALRSNVSGASLVRLEQLPAVTPYGDNSDDYCGERVRASTPGGRLAEGRGWRVVKEAAYHGLNAVLVVRGYDPGTSGHCFAKDPNLAFFDGERLIGVLFSKGKSGIAMNDIEIVGDRLRVWDDLSAVGQVGLAGGDLTFDRVTGSDEVCDGKYRVPAVFGQPWSNARRILGQSGWNAKPSTEETSEGDRAADYRTRFPEVDSCSGTGYAYCSFGLTAQNGIARLNITTAGEDDDPGVVRYDVSCDGNSEQ